jgi:hypothetical protein
MRARQIAGDLILLAATAYGLYKISASGLLDHLAEDGISLFGILLLVILLGAAVARVLRD